MCYHLIAVKIEVRAGVSEWQTRQTQNLLWATTYGFKSHRRHISQGGIICVSRWWIPCDGKPESSDVKELLRLFFCTYPCFVIRYIYNYR